MCGVVSVPGRSSSRLARRLPGYELSSGRPPDQSRGPPPVSLARTLDGTRLGSLGAGLRERFGHLLHEVAKFGAIGALAYVVDVGTFNALRSGSLSERPLTAKVISTVLATTFAYFGNRHWT